MKITVLVDNNTIIDRYLFGEPGVSFFIEDYGKRFAMRIEWQTL